MINGSSPSQTLLFVHAHPDDEALLTAGTMARASAEGHQVHLLVVTDGAAGLTSTEFSDNLGSTRKSELEKSAQALGVSSVTTWEVPDSGLNAEVPTGFAHRNIDEYAHKLEALMNELGVTVLIGYDPSGGYGHPDHLAVHRMVREAHKRYTRSCSLFEATLPREPIAGTVTLAARLRLTPSEFDPQEFAQAWTPRSRITHRVNVRPYLDAKRNSVRAHASQANADNTVRTLAVLSALPRPLFGALLGTEYFVKVV